MKGKDRTKVTLKNILFFVGVILIIIVFIYFVTEPRIFPRLDFSETGSIGDTIGGLSAPIIGILGSYLVYVSFQEQLKANKIQRQALDEEIKRNKEDKWYNQHQQKYDEIKNTLQNFQLTTATGDVFIGLKAIDYATELLSKGRFDLTIYSNLMYILSNILDLQKRLDNHNDNEVDSKFIKDSLSIFYFSVLNIIVTNYINSMKNDYEKINISKLNSKVRSNFANNINFDDYL